MTAAASFESLWHAAGPKGRGHVTLLVARKGGGVHETPAQVVVDPERGLIGDRWELDEARDPRCQLTLMMRSVAELVCGDKPLHLPGDNLVVDLDLTSVGAGDVFAVGSAVVEVTDEPHTGCGRFSQRFGSAALRWVNSRSGRERNLRGVNARVLVGGTVSVGDAIVARR